MTELKPCPFCGGEAITHLADNVPRRGMLHSWYVSCRSVSCGALLGFWGEDERGTVGTYETEDEAIEVWNTRAERTCLMEYNEDWSGDELYPTEAYQCSVCGGITQEGRPHYCPKCGAKVVDE